LKEIHKKKGKRKKPRSACCRTKTGGDGLGKNAKEKWPPGGRENKKNKLSRGGGGGQRADGSEKGGYGTKAERKQRIGKCTFCSAIPNHHDPIQDPNGREGRQQGDTVQQDEERSQGFVELTSAKKQMRNVRGPGSRPGTHVEEYQILVGSRSG